MSRFRITPVKILFVTALCVAPVSGCQFPTLTAADFIAKGTDGPELVVFGDSLSDTGNFKRVNPDEWALAFNNYDDGRFTCGPSSTPASLECRHGVWHEVLLDLPLGAASLACSTNYAFGGARTGPGTHLYSFAGYQTSAMISDLGDQISRFLEAHGGAAPSTHLYVVWASGNDIIDGADVVLSGSAADMPDAIRHAAAEAISNAREQVRRLAQAGATRILWGNMPPLYSTPWATRLSDCADCPQAIQDAVATFNQALDAAVPVMEAEFHEQGLKIYVLDAESAFGDIVLDAFLHGGARYGITNFLEEASHLDPDSREVDSYLFWDGVHPTSHVHAILAAVARDVLLRAGPQTHLRSLD